MANANTFISISKGKDPSKGSSFTIQGSTNAGADFEFRFNALDGQSKPIRRLDALLAIDAIERVLESNQIFTTEMEQ